MVEETGSQGWFVDVGEILDTPTLGDCDEVPNLDETKILQFFHQLWIIDRRVCLGRDLNVFEHSLKLILDRAGLKRCSLWEPAHVGAHGVHSKATARLTFRSHIVDESVGFPWRFS